MAHFLNMNAKGKDLTAVRNNAHTFGSEVTLSCPEPYLLIEFYILVTLISLYFGSLFVWPTKCPANCPQAAAISLPLVVRTVTE